MTRLSAALAAAIVAAATGSALADHAVVEADSFDAFQEAFCAADHDHEHIFVVPIAMFDEHESFACDSGTFGLRKSEPADDPGHGVYNVDPPHGVDSAFDCDAKADIGMTNIALNCIPVSMETEDHDKT